MEGKTNPIEDVGIRLVHGLHDSLQDVTLPNLSQLPGNLNLQNINLAPLPMKARERLSKGWTSGWEAMEQLRDDWNKRVSTGSLGDQEVYAPNAPPGEASLGTPPIPPTSPQVGQAFFAGVDVAKSGAASLATGIGSFFGSQARKTSFFGNGSGSGTVPTRASLAALSTDPDGGVGLVAPVVQPKLSTSPGGTSFLRPLSTAAAATVQASPPSRSTSPVPSSSATVPESAFSPSPAATLASKQQRPTAPAGIGGFFGGLRRTLSPVPGGEPSSAASTPGTASTAGESGFGTPPLSSFLGVGGWGASAATSRKPTHERASAPSGPPLRARDIMGDLGGQADDSDEEDQHRDSLEADRERERTRRKLEGLSM